MPRGGAAESSENPSVEESGGLPALAKRLEDAKQQKALRQQAEAELKKTQRMQALAGEVGEISALRTSLKERNANASHIDQQLEQANKLLEEAKSAKIEDFDAELIEAISQEIRRLEDQRQELPETSEVRQAIKEEMSSGELKDAWVQAARDNRAKREQDKFTKEYGSDIQQVRQEFLEHGHKVLDPEIDKLARESSEWAGRAVSIRASMERNRDGYKNTLAFLLVKVDGVYFHYGGANSTHKLHHEFGVIMEGLKNRGSDIKFVGIDNGFSPYWPQGSNKQNSEVFPKYDHVADLQLLLKRKHTFRPNSPGNKYENDFINGVEKYEKEFRDTVQYQEQLSKSLTDAKGVVISIDHTMSGLEVIQEKAARLETAFQAKVGRLNLKEEPAPLKLTQYIDDRFREKLNSKEALGYIFTRREKGR